MSRDITQAGPVVNHIYEAARRIAGKHSYLLISNSFMGNFQVNPIYDDFHPRSSFVTAR